MYRSGVGRGLALLCAAALPACSADGLLVLMLLTQPKEVTYRIYDDPSCGVPFTGGTDGLLRERNEAPDGGFTYPPSFALPVERSLQGSIVRIEVVTGDAEAGAASWCACPRLPGSEEKLDLPVLPGPGLRGACQRAFEVETASRAIGENCAWDVECREGTCECTNADCTEQRCERAPCPCGWNDQGTCSARAAGALDAYDCRGECQDGDCLLDDGLPCGARDDCLHDHCECADAACGAHRCAPEACVCGWLDEGVCQPGLAPDVGDGDDCRGVCNATGACEDAGLPCTLPADCHSGYCECADATCGGRVCALLPCPCGYADGGGAACAGDLDPWTADAGACGGVCHEGQCFCAAAGEVCPDTGDDCWDALCTAVGQCDQQGRPHDGDGDGHVAVSCGGDDCDDSTAALSPAEPEGLLAAGTCGDGLDNDCDGDSDALDLGCTHVTDSFDDGGGWEPQPAYSGGSSTWTFTQGALEHGGGAAERTMILWTGLSTVAGNLHASVRFQFSTTPTNLAIVRIVFRHQGPAAPNDWCAAYVSTYSGHVMGAERWQGGSPPSRTLQEKNVPLLQENALYTLSATLSGNDVTVGLEYPGGATQSLPVIGVCTLGPGAVGLSADKADVVFDDFTIELP